MKADGLDAEQRYSDWYGQVDGALQEIDHLGGVSISVAAGNEGKLDPPGETGAFMPNVLSSQEGSPLVIAGAVNGQGPRDQSTLRAPLNNEHRG